MSTTTQPVIPDNWQAAIDLFQKWERSAIITDDQWSALTDWLLHSPFGDKSFMAGELGAKLICERAPDEVLDQFVSTPVNNSWVLHFQNVAGAGRNHPLQGMLIEKARRDSNLIVKSFANNFGLPIPTGRGNCGSRNSEAFTSQNREPLEGSESNIRMFSLLWLGASALAIAVGIAVSVTLINQLAFVSGLGSIFFLGCFRQSFQEDGGWIGYVSLLIGVFSMLIMYLS